MTVSVAPLSRTTIEYENGDYSHLVWQEGDRVAYVTDLAGDTFRTAEVTGNCFTASVPEGATTTDNLVVVYPAGDLEGKSLSAATIRGLNPSELDIDASFDGTRLPMTSTLPVPASSGVVTEFDVLPAVIRLSLSGVDAENTEVLKSVTLTANEPLEGAYTPAGTGWTFAGSGNTVAMNIVSENTSLAEISSGRHYIYFVVPRAAYTGVTLTVTTDAGNYTFPDGSMDLTSPTRSLYRLDVALGEPEPVKEPMFVKITSLDQVTCADDDRYLIVCEGRGGLFAEFDSGNYHYLVPAGITPDGIDPASAEAVKCALTLTHPEGEYAARFLISSQNIRKNYPYIGCMKNFSGTPAKLAFRKALTKNSSLEYWDITFDAAGNVLFQAHPDTQDVAGDVFLGFSKSNSGGTFCTYGADATASDLEPLQLYKLTK